MTNYIECLCGAKDSLYCTFTYPPARCELRKIEREKNNPPPVDNAFVKEGCEKFFQHNEIGTAIQAIEYGMENLEDAHDFKQFINDWMYGDISDWQGYKDHLEKHTTK